jgi:hypothetical protein
MRFCLRIRNDGKKITRFIKKRVCRSDLLFRTFALHIRLYPLDTDETTVLPIAGWWHRRYGRCAPDDGSTIKQSARGFNEKC